MDGKRSETNLLFAHSSALCSELARRNEYQDARFSDALRSTKRAKYDQQGQQQIILWIPRASSGLAHRADWTTLEYAAARNEMGPSFLPGAHRGIVISLRGRLQLKTDPARPTWRLRAADPDDFASFCDSVFSDSFLRRIEDASTADEAYDLVVSGFRCAGEGAVGVKRPRRGTHSTFWHEDADRLEILRYSAALAQRKYRDKRRRDISTGRPLLDPHPSTIRARQQRDSVAHSTQTQSGRPRAHCGTACALRCRASTIHGRCGAR